MVTLLSTSLANAQVQQAPQLPQKQHTQLTPQQEQLSQCPASVINSLPPLVPGAFPVCPGSPLLPAGAFNAPRLPIPPGHQPGVAAAAVLSKVQQRLANSPRGTTFDQILQQMTNEGLINCPIITNPHH